MTNGEWMDHVAKLQQENPECDVILNKISCCDRLVIENVEIDLFYDNGEKFYIGKEDIIEQLEYEFESDSCMGVRCGKICSKCVECAKAVDEQLAKIKRKIIVFL
jgi:hypothetical protein